MFKVGEKIVYPVHGAGIIEAIEQKTVESTVRYYYRLNILSSQLRLLVPVDNAEKLGLRYLTDDRKMYEVLQLFSEKPDEKLEKWNKRYRSNMDKLKSGDILQLAEVVRNLLLRGSSTLSIGEKKMLEQARQILSSELVMIDTDTSRAVLDKVDMLAL